MKRVLIATAATFIMLVAMVLAFEPSSATHCDAGSVEGMFTACAR